MSGKLIITQFLTGIKYFGQATPLLLTVAVIELSDIAFAVRSCYSSSISDICIISLHYADQLEWNYYLFLYFLQVDSIPAVFGITRDPFIVFTSNLFAILGNFCFLLFYLGSMRHTEVPPFCILYTSIVFHVKEFIVIWKRVVSPLWDTFFLFLSFFCLPSPCFNFCFLFLFVCWEWVDILEMVHNQELNETKHLPWWLGGLSICGLTFPAVVFFYFM